MEPQISLSALREICKKYEDWSDIGSMDIYEEACDRLGVTPESYPSEEQLFPNGYSMWTSDYTNPAASTYLIIDYNGPLIKAGDKVFSNGHYVGIATRNSDGQSVEFVTV